MAAQTVCFGPFAFNPDNGTLFRGDELLSVGQRGASILAALLDKPGEVVTKAELMDAAWPGVAVEESNLSVQLASLRKLLGSAPAGQDEWIATVPRVGYRFVGKVKPKEPVDAPTAGQKPAVPLLAVLPFQNLSGDPEQDYFADGVVDDIITALTRFKSFAVIARNSSFVYKGRAVDVRQVADELGARYILEGSVRRAKERLRITAQLVDGTTGAHLWARNFDGSVEDVFDMQDHITESVVVVIEPHIRKAELDRSRQKRPESLDAYDLYLQALQKFNTMHPEENAEAFELLERAIALEPEYATALAAAAFCLEHRITMGWPPLGDDDEEKSLQLARAALAIGGDDAVVLARCAIVLMQVGREYDQALLIFEHAIELNPNDAVVLVLAGIGYMLGGSTDEALAIFNRTLALNPGEKYGAMQGIGAIHLYRGQYEEALIWARRALAENPNFNPTHWMLIAAYAHLGRMDEARRALSALQALAPTVSLATIARSSRDPHQAAASAMIAGLRKAGMLED